MAFLPVKYATAVSIVFTMVKRGVMDLALAHEWTPAFCDTHLSIDMACDVYTASWPAAVTGGCGLWVQALTTGETTGKFLSIRYRDAAPKQVEDQALQLFTYGHANAYWPFDLSSPLSTQTVGCVTGYVVGGVHGNVDGNVSGNVVGTIGGFVDPPGPKRATALANFTFEMRDATTNLLKTGLTVTARRKLDGGAWAACTNSVSETSEAGMYTIDLDAADTNGVWCTYKFTATGAIETVRYLLTEA